MNEKWQLFLQQQGAVANADGQWHFLPTVEEHSAAGRGTVLVDLSARALIRGRGQDLVAFLQGQLSNDIRQVDARHSQLTSYSTPKGRMLAIMRVIGRGEEYLLQLPRSLTEAVVNRLRMYVLRSKVTLEPADDLMLIGLSGPEAERLIRQFAGDAPENANDCVQTDQCTVVRLPGPFPRFEVILTIDDAMRIWTSWKSIAQPCGASTWAWLDIMAGLPTVLPETSEAFVPQMANLELIGGVNFKKGCYPGQEIVARMQYLGRLKQRMFRAHVQAETPPRPGMDVYADDFGDQAAGTVVDAQPSPRGGYDMLVVMQIGSARPANVHLGRREGAILAIETLSYAMSA